MDGNRTHLGEADAGLTTRLTARIGVAGGLGLLLMLGACGELRYQIGRPYSTEALENSLTVGQSSEADVRVALGEPDGVGRYLAPVDEEPREMWSYYYETGVSSKQADRTMLFVLFRDQRYDGYLWFSDTLTPTPK